MGASEGAAAGHISIHALLAESDWPDAKRTSILYYFYPRSPCGERLNRNIANREREKFLSTLSLRRATADCPSITVLHCNFYPRSPCGERRCLRCCAISCITISIHALLAESDVVNVQVGGNVRHFYPRSPCGERPFGRILSASGGLFLSTLSLRRATLGAW